MREFFIRARFFPVLSSDEVETTLSSVSKSVVFLEELAEPADGELQEAHCVSSSWDSAPLSSGGGTSVEGCVTGSVCGLGSISSNTDGGNAMELEIGWYCRALNTVSTSALGADSASLAAIRRMALLVVEVIRRTRAKNHSQPACW